MVCIIPNLGNFWVWEIGISTCWSGFVIPDFWLKRVRVSIRNGHGSIMSSTLQNAYMCSRPGKNHRCIGIGTVIYFNSRCSNYPFDLLPKQGDDMEYGNGCDKLPGAPRHPDQEPSDRSNHSIPEVTNGFHPWKAQ